MRIDCQSAPERGLRFDVVGLGILVMVPHPALVEFVGVLAALRPLGDALAFEFEDLRLDRAGDRVGDFILQFEQIGEVSVVSLGHQVMAGIGLDQLRRDADPAPRFAHAAFEDIARAQFLADLLDVDGLAFVGEGRGAGDDRKGAPAGEHRNDVLGHAVGEELLLGIAAEIHKRQDRDGAAVVKGRWAGRKLGGGGDEVFRQLGHRAGHPIDLYRPRNVLEVLGTEILEVGVDLAGDLVIDGLGQIDAARFGQRSYPRCDVDAVAKDVAFLLDDLAEIDSDADRDTVFFGEGLVALRDLVAQSGGTVGCLDDVVEIGEHQFGGFLEDVSAKLGDPRSDHPGHKGSELGEILLLVTRGQPAVAGHQDGRMSAPGLRSGILWHGLLHLSQVRHICCAAGERSVKRITLDPHRATKLTEPPGSGKATLSSSRLKKLP